MAIIQEARRLSETLAGKVPESFSFGPTIGALVLGFVVGLGLGRMRNEGKAVAVLVPAVLVGAFGGLAALRLSPDVGMPMMSAAIGIFVGTAVSNATR